MESNGKKTETHFLNVDLRVSYTGGLKELVEAFAPAVFELGSERETHATFEVNSTGVLSVDDTIRAFYNAVQSLPPNARAIWESADSRCFDIGIQGGDYPHQVSYTLPAETLARLSSMRASVEVTVYAPPKD